jgi:uncharacterized protein (DUF1499 family)
MGLFAGRPPKHLGAQDGRLAPPDARPNNVSSQANAESDQDHYIEPLHFAGNRARAFAAAKSIVAKLDRTRIVSDRPNYLHAESSSKTFGFVDDLELLLDTRAKLIHVRAAARLGIRDFGVNRKRVETLRRRLAEAGV